MNQKNVKLNTQFKKFDQYKRKFYNNQIGWLLNETLLLSIQKQVVKCCGFEVCENSYPEKISKIYIKAKKKQLKIEKIREKRRESVWHILGLDTE